MSNVSSAVEYEEMYSVSLLGAYSIKAPTPFTDKEYALLLDGRVLVNGFNHFSEALAYASEHYFRQQWLLANPQYA